MTDSLTIGNTVEEETCQLVEIFRNTSIYQHQAPALSGDCGR